MNNVLDLRMDMLDLPRDMFVRGLIKVILILTTRVPGEDPQHYVGRGAPACFSKHESRVTRASLATTIH